MAASVSIEPPEASQAGTLAEMWTSLAAGQRTYGSHIEAEANSEQIHRSILRHITAERLLVARTDDLCGFVMFSLEQGSFEQDVTRGFVENLYVRPPDRNEGVGSALLDAAERALRDRGADTVALNVMADNEDARRFYRRHGYDPYRVELEKPLDDE
jgi:ribosomal protein S18 acetylase RimI-like enzyme